MIYFRRRFPEFKDSRKRILLAALVILIGLKPIGALLQWVIALPAKSAHIDGMHIHETPFTATVFIYAITITVVSVYESIYFYAQLRQVIMEKEQAIQAQIRSQLQGLRAQVNPHFLFNSLNTLTGIVEEDQDLAVRFLNKMSKVYRYVLEFREEDLIPLREELEFIRSYVFLQQERFRGKLFVELDVPERFYEFYIVPLSMQILFENAIKHNTISNNRPLRIGVRVADGKLEVRNNLQRKKQVMNSTRVGLNNIRQRYRLLTAVEVEVIETDEAFIVRVPLVEQRPNGVPRTSIADRLSS